MALAFYFANPGMTTAQYDDCVKRLQKAGAGHPVGRSYHSAFVVDGNVHVFDIWTSQAEFDVFGRTLMPILQQMGIDAASPQVMDVHNTIMPASSKPKSKRRAITKRSAAKSGAPRKRVLRLRALKRRR